MSITLEGFRLSNPTIKAIPFVYSSEELRALAAISTSRIVLTSIFGINPSVTNLFFQLFESNPGSGDVPDFVISASAGAQFFWSPGQGGRVYEKLYWAVSSTLATYTASATAFWVDAEGASL